MSIKLRALLGVSALAALAMTGAAHAGDIWGGGSTLIYPAHQTMACNYSGSTPDFFPPPPTPFPGCPPVGSSADVLHYANTGSGVGIAGFFSHDRSRYGVAASGWTSGDVQYALSESPLSAGEVSKYDSGGTLNGVVMGPPPALYPAPRTFGGALVQIPVAIVPVALAYDPTYKKVNNAGTVTSYRFNVVNGVRVNGGLRLDAATYCKIVNGQITDWNDAALTALNGASLRDPSDPVPAASWSVPIELVGDSLSSGITQVLTRHLFAACAGLSGNAFVTPAGTPELPLPRQGPGVGRFTLMPGAPGIAAYTSFTDVPAIGVTLTRGRLGYLGLTYTAPYAGANNLSYALHTATLKNGGSGAFVAPSPATAIAAFAPQTAPETNGSGVYTPGATLWGARNNPADWVRLSASGSSASLANPATGYSIIGTENFLAYTCYATSARTAAIHDYLVFWLNHPTPLTNAGLAAMPNTWRLAITETFLTTPSTPSVLQIATAGAGSSNSNCVSVTGG